MISMMEIIDKITTITITIPTKHMILKVTNKIIKPTSILIQPIIQVVIENSVTQSIILEFKNLKSHNITSNKINREILLLLGIIKLDITQIFRKLQKEEEIKSKS